MKYFLLSPLTWIFAALLAAALTRRGRPALWLGLATAFLWLATAPLGANLLVYALEGPVEPPAARCAAPLPVQAVLLAGGFGDAADPDIGLETLAPESFRRAVEAATWLKARPATRVLISGGGPPGRAESRLMGQLAVSLGLEAERIAYEEKSRTTADSARESAALLGPGVPRVALMTSAIHMPRAALAFRQHGFEVCEVALDRIHTSIAGANIFYYLPSTIGLHKTEQAMHELAGLVAYRFGLR